MRYIFAFQESLGTRLLLCHVQIKHAVVNCAPTNFSHDTQSLLVVWPSPAHKDGHIVLQQLVLVLCQCTDNPLQRSNAVMSHYVYHHGLLTSYRIAGTFEEENFHEFRGFVAIRESFLREIWDVAFFGTAQASNLQKFSPSKVSRYTVHELVCMCTCMHTCMCQCMCACDTM